MSYVMKVVKYLLIIIIITLFACVIYNFVTNETTVKDLLGEYGYYQENWKPIDVKVTYVDPKNKFQDPENIEIKRLINEIGNLKIKKYVGSDLIINMFKSNSSVTYQRITLSIYDAKIRKSILININSGKLIDIQIYDESSGKHKVHKYITNNSYEYK